jgi:hypothetical protein
MTGPHEYALLPLSARHTVTTLLLAAWDEPAEGYRSLIV